MVKIKTLTNYDSLALDFDNMRQPSALLINELENRFKSKGLTLSIGCGTGQYEAALNIDCNVIGLDKSKGMLKISRQRIANCINGDMLNLPFKDHMFDDCYFMQSFHHIGANFDISNDERIKARKQVLTEAMRILKKGHIVIVQRDPSQNKSVWFWKYFPKALEKKLIIQPPIKDVIKWLSEVGFMDITANPVDDPMIKGFYDFNAPLNPSFRKSFSEFSYLSENEMEDGVRRLRRAIADGSAVKHIEESKTTFSEIGGTVFVVSAHKK